MKMENKDTVLDAHWNSSRPSTKAATSGAHSRQAGKDSSEQEDIQIIQGTHNKIAKGKGRTAEPTNTASQTATEDARLDGMNRRIASCVDS